MRFIIEVELELPLDNEGELSIEGWQTVGNFQDALDNLRYEYGWKEIERVSNPKRKEN